METAKMRKIDLINRILQDIGSIITYKELKEENLSKY